MLPKPPHVYYRGCGQNKDIENENIKLKKIQENTPLLYHHNTPKTRNQQRKIENSHLNESAYCLDKFLQEKIVEILQLRAKFQTAMLSCSRFIWITNSSNHSRV